MIWQYVSDKKRKDQLLIEGNTPKSEDAKNQSRRLNNSFDQIQSNQQWASKIRCQSIHYHFEGDQQTKYQRFHDIQIEFPMIRKKRLANIISNPNEYCQRQRNNKKKTLAGTILKKYKDMKVTNSTDGSDRLLQFPPSLQDSQRKSFRSFKSFQLIERHGSNNSIGAIKPLAKQSNSPQAILLKKNSFKIKNQSGKNIEVNRAIQHRQLKPLFAVQSCSPRQFTEEQSFKTMHTKQNKSITLSSLQQVNKVYGNYTNYTKKLQKSLFKGK